MSCNQFPLYFCYFYKFEIICKENFRSNDGLLLPHLHSLTVHIPPESLLLTLAPIPPLTPAPGKGLHVFLSGKSKGNPLQFLILLGLGVALGSFSPYLLPKNHYFHDLPLFIPSHLYDHPHSSLILFPFPPQPLNVRVSQDSLFGSLLTQHLLSAFIFMVPNNTNWIIRKWLIIKSWLTYCII